MQFIDLQKQYQLLEKDIDSRLKNILTTTRFILGSEVQEIEENLATFTNTQYAIGCASGTDALQIALMALNLQSGDEVITTPFTFCATCEVIAQLKLVPVFVDIRPDTYNINADLIEAKITSRTKAIMPVSLYGQCADMDAINAIAKKHGLPVIEDAAQSFGANYKGKPSCGTSTIGTTSFFPSKPLGCYGDGGMMFTNDAQLATDMKIIRNHGQEKRYYHTKIGLNSRLDTIQAAVLLAKMTIFEQEVIQRQQIGARYTELLKDHVKTPVIPEGHTHVYAQYTIEIENNRDEFCQKMQDKNIPTAVHYPIPLHFQPVFKALGLGEQQYPVSERVASRVVSLPMHPYLDEKTQDEIVQKVKECL